MSEDRKPFTCEHCGSKIGAVRHQQVRTYVDIEIEEDDEVSLNASENEVVEETWAFYCLGNQGHVLSVQMVAALDAMIEQQGKFGFDF
jgi:hypothetical protein